MKQLPESRLLAIVALGVACFSAGFSVTASAYANLSRSDSQAETVSGSAAPSATGDLRSCARP